MSSTLLNDGASFLTGGLTACFTADNSLCDSHSVNGPNDFSIAEQIVEEFMIRQAALVQPLPAFHVAIPAQYKRMLRRRETRAFLEQHYAIQKKIASAKTTDNSRRQHAARRPRINGRFAKRHEIAAMELAGKEHQQQETTKKACPLLEYSLLRSDSPSIGEMMTSADMNGDKIDDLIFGFCLNSKIS